MLATNCLEIMTHGRAGCGKLSKEKGVGEEVTLYKVIRK
jgi:hypothetical protein